MIDELYNFVVGIRDIMTAIISSLIVGLILWCITKQIDREHKKRIDDRTYKSILRNSEIILKEFQSVKKISNNLDHDMSSIEDIDHHFESEYSRLKTCTDRIHDLWLNMYNVTPKQNENIRKITQYSDWILDVYFNSRIPKNTRLSKYQRLQEQINTKLSELVDIVEPIPT